MQIATPALAGPQPLGYGGRLTAADGTPVAGPVDLRVRFFDAASAGNQLGSDVNSPGATLVDGVFQIQLSLDGTTVQQVFGGGQSVFVEVTDLTHQRTYPRQAYQSVPYALRVPVDGTTITYDSTGELTVPSAPAPPAPPSAGATQAGYLTSADWVRFNGAPQKSYVDGLNATQAAGVASLSTGLAASNANITGLSTGLAAATANISGLSTGLAGSSASIAGLSTSLATTNTNLTTTNTNLTALNNSALKKDGSVPLTSPWNVGNQDMTNTGSLLMAGSKVFGLSVATSDPAGLTAGDVGKIWFNGGIRLWNGTSAQSLGISGAGLLSLNGLNNNAQTLANGGAGTAPAWSSSGSTHTLNIPQASAGGVTSGLISNAEWTLFNGKQPLMAAAALTGNGFLASSDWALFNAKQNVLTAANGASLGYLTAGDWTVFNSREPAVTAGSTAQYYRGDKSWQTLNSTVVSEGTNLYFTTARAQAAVTAEPPVAAGTASQYYRGDKSWQVLNSSAVTESGNLYFTTGRAQGAITASAPLAYTPGTGTVSLAAGNLTETTSSVLSITGGTGSVIGSGTTIAVTKAAAGAAGYLSSGDWNSFNNKVSSPWVLNGTLASYSSGNVGIGTTNPTTMLYLKSTTPAVTLDGTANNGEVATFYQNNSGSLTVALGSGSGVPMSNGIFYAGQILASNALQLGSGTSAQMTISTAGNVGIGTTNPAVTLDVNGVMRLSANTSQPLTCDASHGGTIAMSGSYVLCLCNTASWVLASDGVTACTWSVSGTQTFSYTGANQNFVVPAGVTSITVKAWGAGGGGHSSASKAGGGGGFATSALAVTPGETLTIIVGGGGVGNTNASIGASGGGRSAVRRSATELITAGAGGGAGYSSAGGAGGGANGASGGADTYAATAAGGGTQASGGTAGVDTAAGATYNGGAGSAFQAGNGYGTLSTTGGFGGGGNGGSGSYGGAGGGGGYYGGGGGAGYWNHGGGGGSSYTTGGSSACNGSFTAPCTAPGAAAVQGNSADAQCGGAGVGGATTGGNGANGKVYISWP